jgi:hypothetical protein
MMTEFDVSPKPCVGSGLCCLKARCWIGARIHGPGDKCPSLVWKDERYWCGEILKAEKAEAESLKQELYVGEGCCMPLFNTYREERFRSMTPEQKEKYHLAVLNFSSRSSEHSFEK